MLLRGDVGCFQRTARHNADRVTLLMHLDANLMQLLEQSAEMLRFAVCDDQIAAGHSGSNDERPRLDAIRDDAVLRSAKFGNALDSDGRSSGPADLCAHLV